MGDAAEQGGRPQDRSSGGTFLHTSRTRPSHVKAKEIPGFLRDEFTGQADPQTGTVDLTPHILGSCST